MLHYALLTQAKVAMKSKPTVTVQTATVFEKETTDNSTAIKLMQKDVGYIQTDIGDIKKSVSDLSDTISDKFVNKEELGVVKSDVADLLSMRDWAVRIVVGAVIVALLALVLKGK